MFLGFRYEFGQFFISVFKVLLGELLMHQDDGKTESTLPLVKPPASR